MKQFAAASQKKYEPLHPPEFQNIDFKPFSEGPEPCRQPIRVGKHTTLTTSIDFVCARLGYEGATEIRWADLIVKTYDFGINDEVFASQDRVC